MKQELGYKEKLSAHVEKIFKSYVTPGLHICDIATGGGKSYTIGKLTCEYYPLHFDRIIILCVQKKLVEGLNREIESFISAQDSLIKPNDKLVIENNSDVIITAVRNSSFNNLLSEMEYQVEEQKFNDSNINDLRYGLNKIKKIYDGIAGLVTTYDASNNNEFILQQIEEGESALRWNVRIFFENFKTHLEHSGKIKKATLATINKLFPSLSKAYPQVEFDRKKVLVMTVYNAMYGIDTILSDKVKLSNFSKPNKKTLILFDESDQAAIAMRDSVIDQSIENGGGAKRFSQGYNGFLQYKDLLENASHLANEYYGNAIEENIEVSKRIIKTNWEKQFGKTEPYKSIFLSDNEDLEDYRRGVFFSGSALRLSISQSHDKTNSYICYKSGERHFRIVHADMEQQIEKDYDIIVPLVKFLSLIRSNVTLVKSRFRKVISDAYKRSKDKFDEEIAKIRSNSSEKNIFLGYPTLEREIHTFFSRFETASERLFEQQMNAFITNRKNQIVTKNNLKLPDYSVYSQGVQLYQEEIDERDNQHRVRLSCREINTTPENIILDLIHFDNTSVVLSSATASCKSVVSNFDIVYLKQILGNRYHTLIKEDIEKFDDLSSKTYPKEHHIDVVPVEYYVFEDKRSNKLMLPEKYRKMFCIDAQKEELADEWFRITYRNLNNVCKDNNNVRFQLNRLFQFIEAYNWFVNHNDVHSMIYFQNRTGYRDYNQFQVLSCLIDGSYKNMQSKFDGDIPSDWINGHLCTSNNLEELEKGILKKLGDSKDAKLFFVSAYGSFKAGTNMQYDIPEGLEYVSGDGWDIEGERLQKDWDAVYLQSPTGYLMVNEDGSEMTSEKCLYKAMLVLTMLYERGCLSREEVKIWLYKAFTNKFFFSVDGAAKDKAAWAQTIVEQAVGRLCRTRNKPCTTYILFDESMMQYFDSSNMNKSMTKEFRALSDFIKTYSKELNNFASTEDIKRCNNANSAQWHLDKMRSLALRNTPHSDDYYDEDFENEEELVNNIPYRIKVAQTMNQSYKQMIIKKPVISSLDDLGEEDKYLTFAYKCYGNWPRNSDGGYNFSYDIAYNKVCPKQKNGPSYRVSPNDVRLDVLMKNDIIRTHFEKNGFATNWSGDGLILHPKILRYDYAGEIGEEAFKALLIHYTDCKEEEIKHLEGKDYELADFVVCNPDGSYKIAFDVKNMNPKVAHIDKPNDMKTKEKRCRKKELLKCNLITVNILQINEQLMDEINEIGGLIDENGVIVPKGIETLRKLVNVR